jgi:hypothetical protein
MQSIKYGNLALSFLLELCMLAMLAYWAYHIGREIPMRILLAIAVPAVVAVLWGFLMAPASPTRLHDPWLTIAELVVFAAAAVAFYSTGQRSMAIAFAVLVALNRVLLFALHQGS